MRAYRSYVALGLLGILAACSSSKEETKPPVVNRSAEIVSFTATPEEVLGGDPTILSWETRNAVGIRIKDDRGQVVHTSDLGTGTFTVTPERTTFYTLAARGKNGSDAEKQVAVHLNPGSGPEATFRIEPAVVPIGGSITLSWETSGAEEIVIRSADRVVFESAQRLSGSLQLSADHAAIYTLTAVGRWGQRVVPAEVKVKPVIDSFSAGKGEALKPGARAGVSWRTRGADALTIRTPEGQSWTVEKDQVDVGTLVLPVGASGIFELVARGGGHETVQSTGVSILGAPTVHSFSASKPTITDREPTLVTLSWAVDDAREGELRWGNGKRHRIEWLEMNRGSFEVELSEATDFTLYVSNEEASAAANLSVTTIPPPQPSLSGPIHVAANEEFVLSWNAVGAERVKIYRGDEELDVQANEIRGSMIEKLTARTVYRLESWNTLGSLRTITRTVEIGHPRVVDLQADRLRYGAGAPMTFTWKATGGTYLQLLDEVGEPIPRCSLDKGGGIEGSCTIQAPTDLGTYTYTLEVANALGRSSRAFTFRVGDGPALDRFEADTDFVTTGDDLTLTWLVLDDVDGARPSLSITDNRGGSWEFPGTDSEPGTLQLVAGAPGLWHFRLLVSVDGKPPVEAEVAITVEAVPELSAQASSDQYDLMTREPVVVEWTTSHAAKVEVFAVTSEGALVDPPVYRTSSPAEAARGSVQLHPRWPQETFEVVASNHSGATDRTRFDFEVLGNPSGVLSFEVSATTVSRGTPVTLSWVTVANATLAPFYDAPIEVTSTAPFEDIHPTGVRMGMTSCGSAITSDDEGCNIVTFPEGFTFPFDGAALPGVTAFANSLASAEMRTDFGSTWSSISKYPASNRPFANFGILYRDNFLNANDQTIRHQLKDGPNGRYMVVQWTDTTDGTFQMVFWESGGLDYRYRTAGSGSGATIGWQTRDLALFHNLNGDRASVTGGLAGRSWRFFEKPQPSVGSLTVNIDRTTIFTLCGVGPFGRDCERRTVRVQ